MKLTVIVEGSTDAEIIRCALGHRADVRVVSASGRSAADSYARTVLVTKDTPVLLVVDADSNDEAVQRERRSFHEASLGQVAHHDRWRVIVAKPEIESVLFQSDRVVAHLLGHELSSEQRAVARYAPKIVAAEVLGDKKLSDAIAGLDEQDWVEVGRSELITQIDEFADHVSANGSVVAA
jgi:5S rRNA maturation endonuclease (ribonuclease M5)